MWLLQGSNLLTCRSLQPSEYRPSYLNPTISQSGKLLFLAVMSWQDCDRAKVGVRVARRAPWGLSWLFFLSAAWSVVALKPRIKGHRKLPVLILDKHVDGLGRPPSQPLSPLYGVCDREGHTRISKHVWLGHGEAVRKVGMQTCGRMTDRHSVRCTVVRRMSSTAGNSTL